MLGGLERRLHHRKDYHTYGEKSRFVSRGERAEAERLGIKVEPNVPPVPYCGLMNPEAFAILKVCDQKDKGAPWEINHDK